MSRLHDAMSEHLSHRNPPTFDKVWLNQKDYNEVCSQMSLVKEGEKPDPLTVMGMPIEVLSDRDAISFIGKKEYHEYIASPSHKIAVHQMPEHMKQIYF